MHWTITVDLILQVKKLEKKKEKGKGKTWRCDRIRSKNQTPLSGLFSEYLTLKLERQAR
jgi:hypothetical protein